jgi:hypothetical protein
MSALAEILERRARLIAEAEEQRHALSEGVAGSRSALFLADRAIAWTSWLRARPYLVVIAATAISVLRPKRMLGWTAHLLTLWRVGQVVYAAVKPRTDERAPS